MKKLALIDEMETLIINKEILKDEAENCLNIHLKPEEYEEIFDGICDEGFINFIREAIWNFVDEKELKTKKVWRQ